MSVTTTPEASASATSAAYPPGYRPRRARNWFFLGLTYASYYLCRYNLGIVSPEFKAGLGFSNTQFGAIQAGRDGAYGLGQFFNGLFADRIGGKQAMTLGALGTVVMNFAFGWTAWSNLPYLFLALLLIRMADGYAQAFGAPGMVKINAAWFQRRERGTFAGIFGGMIQLGAIGVGKLGALLATGFSVPLLFFVLTVPKLDWRYMFIVPPCIVLIMVVLMNLMVKNHPEEAGFRVIHEDERPQEDWRAHLSVWQVFRTIASNPIVWVVALAYMCTGFVRRAIESWWVIYLAEVWAAGKASGMFLFLAVALPLAAFLGSLSSGLVSDKLARGRRAPVAAALYGLEAVVIVAALLLTRIPQLGTPAAAALVLVLLSLTCNSTHSILGTAAAMDVGGRKMSGFSLGLINMFQYIGAVQATYGLGLLLDLVGQCGGMSGATETAPVVLFNPTAWFAAMLPFAILGAGLMLYLTIRYRKTATRGT